jgi:hypothetical protein
VTDRREVGWKDRRNRSDKQRMDDCAGGDQVNVINCDDFLLASYCTLSQDRVKWLETEFLNKYDSTDR